jgi:hypothetical protein
MAATSCNLLSHKFPMVNVQVHSDLLKTEDETKVYINNLCPKFLLLLPEATGRISHVTC